MGHWDWPKNAFMSSFRVIKINSIMKALSFYLCILISFLIIQPVSGQVKKDTLPNGEFENWHTDTLYTEFPPYTTTNDAAYANYGEPNCVPVPGCSGLKGILLTTLEVDGSILPGVLALNDYPIELRGIPYTGTPDSLKACVSYDIMPGDSASIRMYMRLNGAPIAGGDMHFTGQQLVPIEIVIPFIQPGTTPDSMIFVVSSSDFQQGIAGSRIFIDNIRLTGTTEQLPNADLEVCMPLEVEEPVEWVTINLFSTLLGAGASATKTSDSYSGSSALRLETMKLDFGAGESDTLGFLTSGEIGDDGPEGGFPYNRSPDVMQGYYKYTAVGNDTAIGIVAFSRYDAQLDSTIYSDSFWVKLPPVGVYTLFEIPIDLASFVFDPDTVIVLFSSSSSPDIGLTNGTPGVGSALYLDELVFAGGNVSIDAPFEKQSLQLYPNPAKDQVTVSWDAVQGEERLIQVFDLHGRLVKQSKIDPGQSIAQVSTADLVNGVYLVKCGTGAKRLIIRR